MPLFPFGVTDFSAEFVSPLTFDDGPGPSTRMLLDVLRAARCRATFFVLGGNVVQNRDVAVRAVREGHLLGNHTYTHARTGALTASELVSEIDATDAAIRECYERAGITCPSDIPLRLPYGLADDDIRLTVLKALRRDHAGWTILMDDWQRPAPSSARLFETMAEHIGLKATSGESAIICLHDSSRHGEARPATVDAVEKLLIWRRGRGIQYVPPTGEKSDPGPQRP